jgi:3-deoxy-D-manno-octulosonic-acid transferase
MRILYHLVISMYLAVIQISAMFVKKSRVWKQGRRGLFRQMREAAGHQKHLAWFHCASLGEFEQGRPVIERFREQFPAYTILLTFYSPSGYQIRKSYKGADYVFYLPADTCSNAKMFLDLWKPDIAVFIKYEYWYNFLHALRKRNIPVVVVSAIFQPGQHFFRPFGGWFRKHLRDVSHFFVQDQQSEDLLRGIGIRQVTLSGDTRFDRVVAIARKPIEIWQMEAFVKDQTILIAGSTWEADEKILAHVWQQRTSPMKILVAPHQIREEGIRRLVNQFGKHARRFSELKETVPYDTEVLIIDSIGMLSQLYRYGDIAYIGGGFGKGIHNILEAATFGLPVIFGPRYQTFREAVDLTERGGAFAVRSEKEASDVLNALLNDLTYRQQAAAICKHYVSEKAGATDLVMDGLKHYA